MQTAYRPKCSGILFTGVLKLSPLIPEKPLIALCTCFQMIIFHLYVIYCEDSVSFLFPRHFGYHLRVWYVQSEVTCIVIVFDASY